jgi:hypothetical protein
MAPKSPWVSANQAGKMLGLDRQTLFQYRDDGTLKLGPHFAAFSDTFSRDSYRWNVTAIRKHLQKNGVVSEAA